MNLYDTYFNDEVIELLNRYSIHILKVEAVTVTQTFEPSFRLVCQHHTYFAKFSKFGRFPGEYLVELSKLNQMNGNHLLLPMISQNIKSLKRQLNIYDWLDGISLKAVLNESETKTIDDYGYQCGNILREIHFEMKHTANNYNNIVQSFDEYMNRLDRKSFIFAEQFDYRDYFYKNSSMLMSMKSSCFVHMDFKPKNLMLCDSCITVVDLDSSCMSNPWMDFYDKAFSLYPKKEIFNCALIRAYFNNDIPDEFWEFFKVISVYALIKYSACFLRKNGTTRYIRLLESYLWNSYDGFKNTVPVWMNRD